MTKFAYRPIGIVVFVLLMVGRLASFLTREDRIMQPLQVAMLYNSQLFFRPGPQQLEVPAEIHEDPKVSEVEVPEELIQEGTANAVMLMLARNSELEGAVSSVRQLEEKFNRRYHYPWVFLNEEPFTDEFKQ